MTVLSSLNRSIELNLVLGDTVRVVGMIPLRVVEMVPVRVVEIVPVFVVEIVPPFGKATLDIAKINRAEQMVHFRFLIIFSWYLHKSWEAVGSLRCLLSGIETNHLPSSDYTDYFSTTVPNVVKPGNYP